MRFLPDTHLLAWTAAETHRVPDGVLPLIKDPENEIFFSAASIWELTIKAGARKESFNIDARALRHDLIRYGYVELPVTREHAVAVLNLEPIHKDPFDRILVAQAIVEGITLLTVDKILTRYPGPIRSF